MNALRKVSVSNQQPLFPRHVRNGVAGMKVKQHETEAAETSSVSNNGVNEKASIRAPQPSQVGQEEQREKPHSLPVRATHYAGYGKNPKPAHRQLVRPALHPRNCGVDTKERKETGVGLRHRRGRQRNEKG